MEKRKGPAAGKGRVKGVPNKVTKQLKEMILGALDGAGGQKIFAGTGRQEPDGVPVAYRQGSADDDCRGSDQPVLVKM